MQTKLKICESLLDQLNKNTKQSNVKLNDVKEMLQELSSNRSDEDVLGNGVKALKEQLEKNKSVMDVEAIFETSRNYLRATYAAVQRIMNKFGK